MYFQTSSEFNTAIRKDGRTFRARLTCGEECIESGFTSIGIYGGSNNAETITIGSTISQRIEVEMQETYTALSGKEWLLEIGLLTSGVSGVIPSNDLYPSDDLFPRMNLYEYVPVGYFTPEKPSTDNGKTTFKAYDRMIKLSGMYNCLLDIVTTLTVLQDISQITGVPIDVSGLEEIQIQKPAGYTCREILMYIAQLYGKFANVSREGVIEFHWWTQVNDYNITADDTNGFKHDENEFVLGYVYMANTEGDEAVSFTFGDGKQGISVYNPLVREGVVENIFANIGGFTYTASNVSFMKADIRLDPWDVIAVIDNKGNEYKVPLMTLEFKYDGGLSATFSAVGHTETQEEIDFKGPMKLLQERMESKVVDTAKRLQSQITQNAESISAEVKRAIDNEMEIAAAVKVNAESIKSKVSKGSVSSEISQEADFITIKGNRIAIKSDYFELSADGSIVAKSGSFTGVFEQYNSNGLKSVEIKDNQVKVYAWHDDGNYAGSLGSLRRTDSDGTFRTMVSMWCDYEDVLTLNYNSPSDSNTKKPVLTYDPVDIEEGHTPWICNTSSGTLFPDNPSGGVIVENGLIKNWSMTGSNNTIFPDNPSGGIVLKNGLITNWGLQGVTGTMFSNNPNGGMSVVNGLITGWNLHRVANSTLSVITGAYIDSQGYVSGFQFTDVVVKDGLFISWTNRTEWLKEGWMT